MIGTYQGAQVWCNLDGCGFLCAVATWAMMLFSVYTVAFVLLRPTPLEECLSAPKVLTSLAFAALAGLAATAHVRTMLTDPGAVPRNAAPLPLPSSVQDEEKGGERAPATEEEEDEDDEEENSAETSRLTKPPLSSAAAISPAAAVAVGVGRPANHLQPVGMGGVAGGGEMGARRGEVLPTSSGQRHGREATVVAAAAAAEEEQRRQRVAKWCHKCDAFKPPRAHHCSLCQRCIVKMDHHCPWVNNCVGIGNQKLFLLFCVYTCVLCVFALVIELVVIVVIGDEGQVEVCRLSEGDSAATVALSVMSIMFGLFTCCMTCDQFQVASTNQTKIDRLKGEVHEVSEGSNEVFGGVDGQKCRCHWLLPLPARFPPGDAAAAIFGYCISSTGESGHGGSGTQALVGGGVGVLELAERGEIAPNAGSRHYAADSGGGGGWGGGVYAAPEAGIGLRLSAEGSLGDRLSEVDSGSDC